MVSSYYSTSMKVQKYLKEGRGQGIGVDYIPWTKTSDYSSLGRATRIKGIKIPRIFHLQSDIQYRAFLLFEYQSKVIDLRETYPLLDVMETIEHEDLRFDKYRDKETNEPYVITTNFLLTLKDEEGKERLIARTVKNTSELKRKITWEKLEIERRYWNEKEVEWKVITEKQLSRQLAKNLEWIRETMLEGSEGDIDKEALSARLLSELFNNDHLPVRNVLRQFDKTEGLPKGTGLFLFRYLIAKKDIRINLNQLIDLLETIKNLTLMEMEEHVWS
ncbi:MAG: TnsA endonuclease N-terminal domain-containing protein [Heyndrickxia oleronia]|uniref:TnsA endonuclease N-terminal domain-containing protein n=2 Tax=Heyndrickxia oleronia TaxID=38875 RepID=UPI002430D48A|nr:TnsA endonuclease N-terminal domain-containing protein [Heyndrickxia oleronia]MCI1589787.1 TnsA endonuclease N-terminal domain-containing protein [Heyndrickxia oleronia]MCI1613505.1 TnsA endonuclease N-terminal domain-containing protein [Heyndrickxia oleronia]MCI1744380.1 TnsA endonuclease N-terminal domain-containing protein [Heyndrickxia oleronia]